MAPAPIGAVLAAICLWTPPAHGAAADGQFAVKGIGIQTCAQFTAGYAERSRGTFVFAGWIDGYISAVNRLQPGTFDAVPWQSIDLLLALINNHCASSPQERLFSVVHALLDFFAAQRLADSSPSVQAETGENKITVYQEVLRRAQRALSEAGVYADTPDGLFGPKTRAALEAYQTQQGLAKTGLPDQETLYRLLGPGPPAQ